eukprot:Gb_01898 [translate_table: standard]
MALSALKSINVGMAFPFIFLIIVTISLCIDGCSVEDREALMQFKATLYDNNGHLNSWEGEDCCNWRGVHCYGKPRHVNAIAIGIGSGLECVANMSSLNSISLDRVNMSTISTWSWGKAIGSLPKLTHLRLYGCSLSLSDSIPSSFLNLSSLAFLDLSRNSFTSSISHSIGNLSSIQYLDLSHNNLGGEIPSSLRNIHAPSNLTYLNLGYNRLNGTIPSSLGNLSALQYLSLDRNQLERSIPLALGNLSALHKLSLDGNQLQESIPYSFGTLSSLTDLSLSNNQISGNLPLSLALLSSLVEFDLSSNSMLGVISETLLENLTKLSVLRLSRSGLAVNISSAWIPPFQLQILKMGSCKINGSFPAWIATQYRLQFLDLSDNNLVGGIPSWIWDISSHLSRVNLSRNHLEGALASIRMTELDCTKLGKQPIGRKRSREFGRLQSLFSLRIQHNKLNGSLPHSITNCSHLRVLDLRNNAFTGTIPSWMGNFSQLQVLIMKFNSFEGRIPLEIGRLSQLRVLDMSSNYLSGSIPKSILNLTGMTTPLQRGFVLEEMLFGLDGIKFYRDSLELTTKGQDLHYTYILSTLTYIDLSKNLLTGHVPTDIGKLKGLMFLNLSMNQLSGPIPLGLANLTQLESLDLSTNNLSGKIPWELEPLNFIGKLNLSNNQLSGKIPRGGHMLTFENSSFLGNPELCGDPLTKKCYPEGSYPPPPSEVEEEEQEQNGSEIPWWEIAVGLSHGVGFAGVVSLLAIHMEWRRRWFQMMDAFIHFLFDRRR